MKIYLTVLSVFITFSLVGQDQIIKTNGEEIFGKVLKINATDVVFKRKDNLDGPEYVEYKTNILFIKYENGTKEIFTTANTPVVANAISTICNPLKRKNSIFIDLGGNGFALAINYERKFFVSKKNNFLTAKVGFGPLISANILNITSTYNIGDGMNFFEFGGGLGGIYNPSNSNFLSYRDELNLYFTPTIGYRRQSGGGFLFRSYLTILTTYSYNNYYVNNGYSSYYSYSPIKVTNYYPFLGISIGYSF